MPSVPALTKPKKPEACMNTETRSPRIKLIREAAVLQLKLLADGLRDALLIPISLGAICPEDVAVQTD